MLARLMRGVPLHCIAFRTPQRSLLFYFIMFCPWCLDCMLHAKVGAWCWSGLWCKLQSRSFSATTEWMCVNKVQRILSWISHEKLHLEVNLTLFPKTKNMKTPYCDTESSYHRHSCFYILANFWNSDFLYVSCQVCLSASQTWLAGAWTPLPVCVANYWCLSPLLLDDAAADSFYTWIMCDWSTLWK